MHSASSIKNTIFKKNIYYKITCSYEFILQNKMGYIQNKN